VSEQKPYRTPFVLGMPIKDPVDFYGRTEVLRECFRAAVEGQYLAVVGEHRAGNTSVLYQLLHEEQRARYLSPEEGARLVFTFVSSQLGNEDPGAFLRRVARGVRRADPDSGLEAEGEGGQAWLEDYLDHLAARERRLVLLLDEFEVLAHFDPAFWEWFQVLTTEYDVAVIASTRSDLGEFRAQHGGPPMYNMFRSITIGSWSPGTVDQFLADRRELTDFDFQGVRAELDDLGGRFPFYLQSAAALFYVQGAGESQVTPVQVEEVRREFELRTRALFDDAWGKLPEAEREALTWLVLDTVPEGRDEIQYQHALRSLERRGYLVEGRPFSSALARFVRLRLRPVGTSSTADRVRVGRSLVPLGPQEMGLLRFLLAHQDRVVTEHEVAHGLWPESGPEPTGETVEEIWRTVEQLKHALDAAGDGFQALEILPDEGYRLRNPTNEERPWVD
jgi:DNA-binding winged helix-turn-helix (wHTH) protein